MTLLAVTTHPTLEKIQNSIEYHQGLVAAHQATADRASAVLAVPLLDDRVEHESRKAFTDAAAMIASERSILAQLVTDAETEARRLAQPSYAALNARRIEAEARATKLKAQIEAGNKAGDQREALAAAMILDVITARAKLLADQHAAVADAEALRAECKFEPLDGACPWGSCLATNGLGGTVCASCPRAENGRNVIGCVSRLVDDLRERARARPVVVAPRVVAPPPEGTVQVVGAHGLIEDMPAALAETGAEFTERVGQGPYIVAAREKFTSPNQSKEQQS